MALFRAYFDESYGNEDAYSVAGYIGTVRQWEEFEADWLEMLDEFGVSYMHKSDLEHLQGDFKQWRSLSKPDQDELKKNINQKAIAIIKRRVSAGFSVSVKKSDWDAISKGLWTRMLGSGFYAAGARACMQMVAGWAKKNRKKSIDYLFESGAEGAHELREMIKEIHGQPARRRHYKLGTWSFGDGKPDKVNPDRPTIIQFQAADFLAYESYRHMGNRVVGGIKKNTRGDDIPMRGAYRELIGGPKPYEMKPPHYMLYYDWKTIIILLKELSKLEPLLIKRL